MIFSAVAAPAEVAERSYLIVSANEELEPEKRSYLIVSANEELEPEKRAVAGDTLVAADGTKYSLVPQTK